MTAPTQDQLLDLVRQQLTGGPSVAEGLAQLVSSDPQLGQLTELLARREQQLRAELEEREEEERRADGQALQLDERRRRAQSWRDHLAELTAELDAARAQLDELASALGACPGCLGSDPGCRWCRGRGGPGFTAPDPAGFERLVLPAVHAHVRLHRPRRTASSSSTTPSTGERTAP